MIQRIQSIWLFLAALTLAAMLIFPLASKDIMGVHVSVSTMGVKQHLIEKSNFGVKSAQYLPLLTANIALALLCVVNIFNFKKRKFQKQFAWICIVLIAGFAYWCSVYLQKMPNGISGATFQAGAFLPAGAILFNILAIFGINKDEKLIRSAERLR